MTTLGSTPSSSIMRSSKSACLGSDGVALAKAFMTELNVITLACTRFSRIAVSTRFASSGLAGELCA